MGTKSATNSQTRPARIGPRMFDNLYPTDT